MNACWDDPSHCQNVPVLTAYSELASEYFYRQKLLSSEYLFF